MKEINYIIGDATEPQGDNPKIIAHICNDIGEWGSGFVVAISKKWKEPEQMYRMWYKDEFDDTYPKFTLGNVQVIQVIGNIYIANMIAQHDIQWHGDIPPIRYDRLRQCLNKVANISIKLKASVHMPRIGSGLAGGTWQVIEGLIKETLISKEVLVYIYDLLDS